MKKWTFLEVEEKKCLLFSFFFFFELIHFKFGSLILVLFRENNSIANDDYLPNYEAFFCYWYQKKLQLCFYSKKNNFKHLRHGFVSKKYGKIFLYDIKIKIKMTRNPRPMSSDKC